MANKGRNFWLEMGSKLFEPPSDFFDCLTALVSELQTIMRFGRFWPFLAN